MRNFILLISGLLFAYQGLSQKQFDIDIVVKDASQNISIVEFNITNSSKEALVIGLQNWQVISLPDFINVPVGFPLEASMLNFVFLTKDTIWHPNKLYHLDWEITFDSIPDESLKMLRPKQSFKVSVLINDSFENVTEMKVAYVFNAVPYKRIKKSVKSDCGVFFKQNRLVVLNTKVNYSYIERPSRISPRFYNSGTPYSKINFSQIRKKFIKEVIYQQEIKRSK